MSKNEGENVAEDGVKRQNDASIEIPASLVSPVLASWNDSTRKIAESGNERYLERRKSIVPLKPYESSSAKSKSTDKEGPLSPYESPKKKLAFRIEQFLPNDPDELRKTGLFQAAIRSVQHQRDQYLVGKEYADWQRDHRDRPQPRVSFWTPAFSKLVYDPAALGHNQLAHLAGNFLPSPTMLKAALPLVTSLPTTSLYPIAQETLTNQIHGRQEQLNQIVKRSIVNYLTNPDNRVRIKTSANSAMLRRSGGS